MNTANPHAGAPERDWDPSAALRRLAGDDAENLKARLRQAAETYAQAPKGHLSFEAMQDVVAGDPQALDQHAQHLEACEYCAALQEAMTTTPAEERALVSSSNTMSVRQRRRPRNLRSLDGPGPS